MWQPIETALSDGTTVDLWVSMGDSRYRETDCHWTGSRWVRVEPDGEGGSDWEEVFFATHWMPLPAPPSDPTPGFERNPNPAAPPWERQEFPK